MSGARQQLREMIIADIQQHRPEQLPIADQIIDRLLAMEQLQSDDNVIAFINSYRRALEKRDNKPQQ